MRSFLYSIGAALGLTLGLNAQSQAVFVFESNDPAGTGFNDATRTEDIPIVESGLLDIVGDNPGATLGELRLNVLRAAGDAWAQFLLSDVPIEVDVAFLDQGGLSGGSITLASASVATLVSNFTGAIEPNTFYPVALANSLAGRDLRTAIPDINVNVNSNAELSGDLLPGGGLPGLVWYYGLDNNAPAGTIDFLSVLTHELGHGLGFSSTVNLSNGQYIFGSPDIYARHIFDTEAQQLWTNMTAAQRLASASNDPNLTWDGEFVRNAVDGVSPFLQSGLAVNPEGSLPAQQADFGGALSLTGLSGRVILTDDGSTADGTGGNTGTTRDAAQDIINGSEVSGNIALIERGVETFYAKVQRAEAVGASAVILYNNRDGDATLAPTGTLVAPIPTIPVVFISENSGAELLAMLAADPNTQVNVTPSVVITGDGGETEFRARLNAPAAIQPGSSISHWSPAVSPNLLMEPSINPNLDNALDLSPVLMRDLGWRTTRVNVPHVNYSQWLAENGLTVGAPNALVEDDADGDGVSNLLEYFSGTNPVDESSIPRSSLTANTSTGASSTGGSTSSTLTFSIERDRTPSDLRFELEGSQDLGSIDAWQSMNVPFRTSPLTGEREQVDFSIDTSSAPASFFRLRVEQE